MNLDNIINEWLVEDTWLLCTYPKTRTDIRGHYKERRIDYLKRTNLTLQTAGYLFERGYEKSGDNEVEIALALSKMSNWYMGLEMRYKV